MTSSERKPFDFNIRADNGLRRGITTGTCATAASKAALLKLLLDQEPSVVQVNLVDGLHYVTVPIQQIEQQSDGRIKASVVKDAGDDPDVTHRATIFVLVRPNNLQILRFFAGVGVGTITQPGFAFPVGEPAINPIPRQMMRNAVEEVLVITGGDAAQGFDLEVGCDNGVELAKKTYNPRLGIVGGISILGTTGIVEPKSLSSWLASIDLYIRIALANHPESIVFAPGNLGQKFALKTLGLPLTHVVQMANFVGFALDALDRQLKDAGYTLPQLWIAGHPGKLAKLLNGDWDTHSGVSQMAMPAVCQAAESFGFDQKLIEQCQQATTVEQVIRILEMERSSTAFWDYVEMQIAALVQERVFAIEQVNIRLFKIDGTLLRGRSS